jgi:prepilin-type N-terminal cleavage/methylation domain-containing protein
LSRLWFGYRAPRCSSRLWFGYRAPCCSSRLRAKPGAGFTLLEVLVALVIFALSFGALAEVIATGFRQTEAAGRTLEATLIARSILAAIGSEVPLQPGEQEGDAAHGFRFSIEVQPTDLVNRDFGIAAFRIRIRVFDADRPARDGVRLTTLRIGALPE